MPENIREAVGVFDNPEKVDAAIADLEGTAFPRHDISVLGSKKEVREKLDPKPLKSNGWRIIRTLRAASGCDRKKKP